MKRFFAACLATLCLTGAAFATESAEENQIVTLMPGSHLCVMEDEVRAIDPLDQGVSLKAEEVNGVWVTLLPLRSVLEAFGGEVTWTPPNGVTCSLGENSIALQLGESAAVVNGVTVPLDVPARAENGRTYLPLRFVVENLKLNVAWEPTTSAVVLSRQPIADSALATLPQVQKLSAAYTSANPAVTLQNQTFTLSSGTVNAYVVEADLSDPRVTVKAAHADDTLAHTQPFSQIVANSSAKAILNANFFNSYSAVKDPVGHLMVNGQMYYGSSGRSTLAVTKDNKALIGRPGLFYRIKTADGSKSWALFEVNVTDQFAGQAVIYTPQRGASFEVKYPGYVMVVENNVITTYGPVVAGNWVGIPAGGYVAYFSTEVAGTDWHATPVIGETVEAMEPYIYTDNGEPFDMTNVMTMINGAPRLVKNGQWETYEEPEVSSDAGRFGYGSTPRTVVGLKGDKLIFVSTGAATLNQMRELMLSLGCEEAFNLDGGGSRALAFDGKILANAGRELTATIQIFVTP